MNAAKRFDPLCPHPDVLIKRIIRADDPSTRCRTIGGECQRCYRSVERIMTLFEIQTGKPQTDWRTS